MLLTSRMVIHKISQFLFDPLNELNVGLSLTIANESTLKNNAQKRSCKISVINLHYRPREFTHCYWSLFAKSNQ